MKAPPPGLALLLAGIAVFLVYTPSFPNDFIYDDVPLILEHEGVHDLAEVRQVFREPHFPNFPYYRPITRTTLLVQKALHGDEPLWFHVFNALLAALTAGAAFWLLRSPGFRIGRWPALFAALAFAIHPVASSCVYPICSGRETLLPSALILAAVAAWLRPGALAYGASLVLLALALLGKEQAVVVPVLLLAADRLGRAAAPRRWSASALRLLPVVFMVAGYLWIRHRLFGGQEFRLAVLDEPSGPLLSLWFGMQSVFAPAFALAYEPEPSTWWSGGRLVLTLAVLAFLAVLTRAASREARRGLWFWPCWYVVLSLPTANFLWQDARFSERYVFLASLAVYAWTAMLFSDPGTRSTRLFSRVRVALLWAGGAALLALAAISALRARHFRDDRTFAVQWLRTAPEAFEAHGILANVARREGRIEDAIRHNQDAVRCGPEFATAHLSLADLLLETGRPEAALESAQALARLRPRFWKAYYVAGRCLNALDRGAEAVEALERGLGLEPASAELHNELGIAYAQLGRVDRGFEQFEIAVQSDPAAVGPRINLARALEQQGRLDEAEAHLRTALEREPGQVRAARSLAGILLARDRLEEAVETCRRQLALRPRATAMRHLLARALTGLGRSREAVAEYRTVLAEQPGSPAALELAWLLATCTDSTIRDGTAARRLLASVRESTDFPEFVRLDVEAAAAAESGDFAAAVDLMRRARDQAARAGAVELGAAMGARLEAYAAGRAHRAGPEERRHPGLR